ncbi:MAG: tetratricopeptide repeat protein [Chloroflexi bacterium AL-N10]|nr:tetratricopeptide repeat protein [Chloroflexi bacterium AL-N10]NOK92749.1 tetratricopeptide repeat protein [Chloroflexi bacterium AL-N15]
MYVKPLGTVLQKADLISTEQIEMALRKQTKYKNKRLGEILASQGLIKQETANFFAEQWPTLVSETSQQPLGQYLKRAFLLNETQIEDILSEQKRTGLRFGTLVALKGLIKQTTINFFVESLNLSRESKFSQIPHIENSDISHEKEDLKRIHQAIINNKQCEPIELLKLYRKILQQEEIPVDNTSEQLQLLRLGLVIQEQNHLKIANSIYKKVFNLDWVEEELIRLQRFERIRIKLFQLDKKASSPYTLIEAILSWTGGEFFLTQKLCELINESEVFIPAGQENYLVEQLVENHLIDNWENQAGIEIIKKIDNGLLTSQQCETIELLKLYRQILKYGEIPVNDTLEQAELIQLGLIIQDQNHLKVANRIYEKIFNLNWIEEKLIALYPFNQFGNELVKLQKNASSPCNVLEEILSWTNADIFLTQKLSQLISESKIFIPASQENQLVAQIVENYLLDNSPTQIKTELIRKMRNGFSSNQEEKNVQLLKLYQQVLEKGKVLVKNTLEETQLLKLGLVIREQDYLKVANPIYKKIFNLDWIKTELTEILLSLTTKIKKNSNNSQVSIIANEDISKKQKTKKINVPLLLLLLIIPGLLGIGWNFLSKARLANNFQQGNELLNQDKYQEAIAKYDKVLNRDNKSYEALTNRGYALAGLREYSQMLESCSAAIEIEPNAIYAFNCQGEALHNLNQPELALTAFDKAIAINPNDPIFWINKSESLLSLKRFDEAVEMIDQAIDKLYDINQINNINQVKRELSVALSSKGRILGEKKFYQEALASYDRALDYDPDYFPAQRGRGITLKELGRYYEAGINFDIMLENPTLSDTQKAEIWFYKGLNLCQQRKTQAGVNAFEEALKLKSDYEAAKSAILVCN